MQITDVNVTERRSMVSVKGWQSVEMILTTYANGLTPNARDVEKRNLAEVSKYGDTHATMYMLGAALGSGKGGALVEKFLAEAKQNLTRRTRFSKSYDYDADGTPFFKTSINVFVLDREEDVYGIQIGAHVVGDTPTRGLAEHFGLTQALQGIWIHVVVSPLSSTHFEFDFGQVCDKLSGVLCVDTTLGPQIVRKWMETEHFHTPFFCLPCKEGLDVRVVPGHVDRADYDCTPPLDRWIARDSLLSGPLARDWSGKDEHAKVTPSFLIKVSSAKRDDYDSGEDIWRVEEQQTAIDLASKIAAALK